MFSVSPHDILQEARSIAFSEPIASFVCTAKKDGRFGIIKICVDALWRSAARAHSRFIALHNEVVRDLSCVTSADGQPLVATVGKDKYAIVSDLVNGRVLVKCVGWKARVKCNVLYTKSVQLRARLKHPQ